MHSTYLFIYYLIIILSLLNILQERRIQAVREIFRVLKPSGSALLYAWAKDQEINCQPSTYLSSKTETDQQMPATVRDNFSKTKCKKIIREIEYFTSFFRWKIIISNKKRIPWNWKFHEIFDDGMGHGFFLYA